MPQDNPSQIAFAAEYDVGTGIRTTVAPALNAGIMSVLGTAGTQATPSPVSSAGNVQSGTSVGYNSGTGWWMGFDKDGIPKMFLGKDTGNKLLWTGTALIISGNITAGSLDIPDITTANSFHVDTNGNAWWGTNVATGYATAPASILNTGAAKFTSVKITGLQSGSSLDGQYLANNTVTSGKISVSQLSAISADMGTITAGTVTGATIQTATSGQRVVITGTNDDVRFYNSGGTYVGTIYGTLFGGSYPGIIIDSPNDYTHLVIGENGSLPYASIGGGVGGNYAGISMGEAGTGVVKIGSKLQIPVGTNLY